MSLLVLINLTNGIHVTQVHRKVFDTFSVPSLNGSEEPNFQSFNALSYKTAIGSQSILAFLVEFTDVKHKSSFNEIINKLNSTNDYFNEVSYGIISLNVFINSSWILLPFDMGYYGHDVNKPGNEPNIWKIVFDALLKMDQFYDYSKYDHFMIIHAGDNQAISNPTKLSNDIWSSFIIFDEPYKSDEGTLVYGGIIVSENDPMGVFTHELGHSLGLPDLYDITNSDPNDFVGKWDLMSKGSWNGVPHGTSPAHLCVWGKIKLGWIQANQLLIVNKEESAIVDIFPIEVKALGTQAIKLPITTNKYYLLEFRKKIGFDSYLPNSGILIYYCDDSIQSGYGPVRLKDANPSTLTLDDASFDVDQYFLDETNNIYIKIISKDQDSFRIKIDRKTKEFSVSVIPQYIKTCPGSISKFNVTITYLLGSDYTVVLDVLNSPNGIEFYFDNSYVSGNSSVFLTLIFKEFLLPGSYILNITATSNQVVRFVLLTIEVFYEPDFVIKAYPSSKTIVQGESFNYIINITSIHGFDFEVFIEITGISHGIDFTLSLNPVKVKSNSYNISILSITTYSTSPIGSHRINIVGLSGNITHSIEVYLIISESKLESFRVSVYPSKQVIHVGSVGRWTITIEALKELNSPVLLSIQNLPSNVTAFFDRNELMPSPNQPAKSTLVISVGSLAKKGVYNITVIATEGLIFEMTTFELHIPSAAIPGFQLESIFIGLTLGILFLKRLQRIKKASLQKFRR
ncbi:MAG: M6 family metalloprotease domain-containing protein [Candidatus Bathyarchaeia archaeon]